MELQESEISDMTPTESTEIVDRRMKSNSGISKIGACKSISVNMSETDKFMDKFDPVNSNREMRKKMRGQQDGRPDGKQRDNKSQGCLYDDKGALLSDGADVCDCLDDDCPGCHFPCEKCRSSKCGVECRVRRRWVYDHTEVEGTNIFRDNKHVPK